jgi:hypothetical protein
MTEKYLIFELEDKTIVKLKNDEKLYRIGLIRNEYNKHNDAERY